MTKGKGQIGKWQKAYGKKQLSCDLPFADLPIQSSRFVIVMRGCEPAVVNEPGTVS